VGWRQYQRLRQRYLYMRLTRILLVLLLLAFVTATVVSLVINVVIQQENGTLEEGELDVVGNLSIAMRILLMTAISAPGVFLNCWRWVRETTLLRFLSFVLLPSLGVGWPGIFFTGLPDKEVFFLYSAVFLAAQVAAFLWFSSVVRGDR